MKAQTDIEKLLAEISSNDLTVLIPAMDQSVVPLSEFAARVARMIEDSDYGVFVAERLSGMIFAVLREVENFHFATTDTEAKVHSAVTLLLFGSKAGVPALLEAVETSQLSASFAARKLANAGVTEVFDRIIGRLRRHDISNPRVIVSLLATLKDFNVDLPSDLESTFLSDDTSDEVREFVRTEWPHPPASLSSEMSTGILRV